MLRKILFPTFFFLIIFFLPTKLINAQQNGITVSPSIMHLDLGTDSPEYELTYINNTNTEVNLLLRVEDFTELEDSYKISYLQGKDATSYKYSLSSWITFENKTLQLSPHQQKSIKIFIDTKRITKGGHYASILAEIVQPESKKQVSIKAIIASLLFVRASTGLEIEDGKISSFRPERDWIEYPDTYVFRFENNGNVYIVPYGLVQIYDPLGNFVAKGIINDGSLDALPESIRRYDIKVNTYQKFLLPGIYSAKISIHFGKTNQKLSTQVKFFSQGSLDFAKIFIAILIAGLIFMYLKKKAKRKD